MYYEKSAGLTNLMGKAKSYLAGLADGAREAAIAGGNYAKTTATKGYEAAKGVGMKGYNYASENPLKAGGAAAAVLAALGAGGYGAAKLLRRNPSALDKAVMFVKKNPVAVGGGALGLGAGGVLLANGMSKKSSYEDPALDIAVEIINRRNSQGN